MKYLVITILLGIAVSSAFAQKKEPDYFLARIPDVPSDACSKHEEQTKVFHENVSKLSQELTEEIADRQKLIKTDVKNSEDQIKKDKAKEIGLSDADVQKLKNKNISEAEKKAIIDKMLKDKTNISLKEVENLKKMSKEGKEQWAEGYSTQQMANMTGNPDSNKTEEQKEFEKNLEKNKNLNDLAQEQQLILNKISASDKKFANQMTELNKKDSIATIVYNNAVKDLKDRLYADPPPEPEVRKQIEKDISNEGEIYCNKLTPDFCDILNETYSYLVSRTLDYKRLDEVNAELNKAMLKTDKDFSSPGLFYLQAISGYVNWLGKVYMYEKGDSDFEEENDFN
jgi:hypothetical protein